MTLGELKDLLYKNETLQIEIRYATISACLERKYLQIA